MSSSFFESTGSLPRPTCTYCTVHLYSSVFAVNLADDNKKPFEKNTEVEDEEKTGEILALLPHFLAFASLTSAGSFPIESYPLSIFQGGF